jgi:hypothetical protein
LIQVAELSSEALEVTNAVEIWGCEQAAANTPGVNAELGPEVAAHALTTCRPVPPTDSSFPTSVVNPGPEEFGPEIAFFQEFGGGTLSTRWSGTVTQLMVQLRSTASGLAQTLGVGANDQIWSSQIRTYLIKLVTLIPKLEQVLKAGH